MIRKSFILFSLAAFTSALVFAQTPEAKKDNTVMSWSFDGGSYIGVQTEEVTKENFAKFGLREVRGVAVEKVIQGSPAAAAGIQNGDVIVRFNGEEITSTRKLTRLISEVAPDHTAKVTVVRGGSEREISVTVAKRPFPKFEEGAFNFKFPNDFPNVPNIQIPRMPDMPPMGEMPRMPDMPRVQPFPGTPGAPGEGFVWQHFGSRRQIGVGITPLTKQLSEHFGVKGGIMINSVLENSAAAKAGLKAGDIIVEVEGKELKGEGDLQRAIHEKKEGDISLTIVRGGSRQTVRVTPEEVRGGFNTFFDFPDAPDAPPEPIRAPRPGTPPTPMPLDQFMVRGRIL